MDIKTLKDKERELIQEVLSKTDWNLEKASRLLQIPLSQVKRKIREHGMKKTDAHLMRIGPQPVPCGAGHTG